MTIKFVFVGKTFQAFIEQGCEEFVKRIGKYNRTEVLVIPDEKRNASLDPSALKRSEAQAILKHIKPEDFLILLDERGKSFSSVQWAAQLQKFMNQGPKNLVFLVGGAFGFDEAIYQRSNFQWSLSNLTFSHQMVRLFLIEQVYRAFTILKNEPYHNE
ncbi:MAG TPA: 23S rRNA (pseudouridine(1915)-N(3))-methyltransferase RlmH [Luteibaculaceae bacterium]|nr:23S rRNA (pseudouridine(1915)-N(3))-methyltransferase RlmH [Luteibaculaceae bacterium]